MNRSRRVIPFTAMACIGIVGLAGPRGSAAQTAPAASIDTPASHSSAQSEAGEPRATTSPDAPASTAEPTGPAADPRAESSSEARRAKSASAMGRGQGGGKAEGGKADGGKADGGKGEAAGKSTAADKLELQTATVTGDREQPKVMYIVPWKKSDIGDLSGKPMNSLLDEALAPVDREEFKREVMYYQAVRADASQNGAAAGGAAASGAPASSR